MVSTFARGNGHLPEALNGAVPVARALEAHPRAMLAHLLLAYMAMHADEGGVTNVSQLAAAENLGVHRRSIQEASKSLVDAGLVVVVAHERGRATVYRLAWVEPEPLRAVTDDDAAPAQGDAPHTRQVGAPHTRQVPAQGDAPHTRQVGAPHTRQVPAARPAAEPAAQPAAEPAAIWRHKVEEEEEEEGGGPRPYCTRHPDGNAADDPCRQCAGLPTRIATWAAARDRAAARARHLDLVADRQHRDAIAVRPADLGLTFGRRVPS